MEEIAVNSTLEYLSEIKLEDLFPQSIRYPNQQLSDIILEETSHTTQQTHQTDKSHKAHKAHKTDKRASPSNPIKISKENYQTINFDSDSETILYDVFIKDNFIFACGGNLVKVFNKNNLVDPEITFFSSNKDEDFYALAYSEIVTANSPCSKKILAVGGKKSVIKILDLQERSEMHELIGHRNEIYDLKFNPTISYLLLSASQDFSIRLWHATQKTQICIFGGPNGAHNAEVISVDWHLSGNYFVSSGIDYSVKIWELTENITKSITQSSNSGSTEKFRTVIKSRPLFSCSTVHDNYVDCVKFNGQFILSKSVDGVIHEWMPVFNPGADSFLLINTYIYAVDEHLWYFKFSIEALRNKLLAVGNGDGEVFLFKLNEEDREDREEENGKTDYFHKQKAADVWRTPDKLLIRSVYLDQFSIVVGTSEGKIYFAELHVV